MHHQANSRRCPREPACPSALLLVPRRSDPDGANGPCRRPHRRSLRGRAISLLVLPLLPACAIIPVPPGAPLGSDTFLSAPTLARAEGVAILPQRNLPDDGGPDRLTWLEACAHRSLAQAVEAGIPALDARASARLLGDLVVFPFPRDEAEFLRLRDDPSLASVRSRLSDAAIRYLVTVRSESAREASVYANSIVGAVHDRQRETVTLSADIYDVRRWRQVGSAQTVVAGQSGYAGGGLLTLGLYTVYWVPVGMEGAACDGLATHLAARWTILDGEARQ